MSLPSLSSTSYSNRGVEQLNRDRNLAGLRRVCHELGVLIVDTIPKVTVTTTPELFRGALPDGSRIDLPDIGALRDYLAKHVPATLLREVPADAKVYDGASHYHPNMRKLERTCQELGVTNTFQRHGVCATIHKDVWRASHNDGFLRGDDKLRAYLELYVAVVALPL